jgi:hypothetical protein
VDEEARTQKLHDSQCNLSAESSDAVGELLAGSGFENEEPEPGLRCRRIERGGVTTMAGYYFPAHRTSAHGQTGPSRFSLGGYRRHYGRCWIAPSLPGRNLGLGARSRFNWHSLQPNQRKSIPRRQRFI